VESLPSILAGVAKTFTYGKCGGQVLSGKSQGANPQTKHPARRRAAWFSFGLLVLNSNFRNLELLQTSFLTLTKNISVILPAALACSLAILEE